MTSVAPTLRWRTSEPPSVTPRTVGFWDRLARESLARVFRQLRGGTLRLVDGDGPHIFGSNIADSDLSATVIVENPAFYRHAVLGGNLSIAESYLSGDWHCSDLTALFRLFTRNVELSDGMDSGLRRLLQWPALLYHRLHANSRSGSRQNIHLHYDLGNDFFALMLDETMAYSSGIYPHAGSSLREASLEKMDRLCRKLELRSTDRLLEIGTGWGGLAIHAAKHYG